LTWSAKQYTAFERERTRPVRDLVAAIPTTQVRTAIDIGCGPGNSTEVLLERFPGATVSGLDSSQDMLDAARKRLPQLRFAQVDLEAWNDPGPFDVILANAVLHWLPDHPHLFPSLVGKLAPGGSLAVQMPDNFDDEAHRLMRDIAAHGPWAHKLSPALHERTGNLGAQAYFELLRPFCDTVDVWRTIYHHPLAGGANGIVEWFKGSALRPFLERLDADERSAFLARYAGALESAYPALPDGTVLLPFPRLFIVATR
jgi:trans-aconitate 2-methyltransferase